MQCKTLIITEHTHNFHWTGTNPPVVSSNQQDFLRVEKSANGEDYDKAIFRFKKPLTYNDFTIIQFKMDIDNSDNKGKKYVAHKVEENIQLINFRVELMYLVNGKDAKILRKKLNTSLEMSFENIGFVKFEEKTKSYSHSIYNPEVGYTYRLDWS